ncbi:MAG: ATPase, partial [uncultured Sulfurovum sp.]
GTGWDVDTSKSVDELIKEKVLSNYEALHKGVVNFTHGNGLYHLMLTIIALGVEFEDAVFKKAGVGIDKGEDAVDYLELKSLLKFDASLEEPRNERYKQSDKLLFEFPFMRFWFAVISPYYQSISSGDFTEFEEKWNALRGNFSILLSNHLALELAKERFATKFESDPIVSMGSYYDKKIEITILAKRKSGKMLAGECKYSKTEAKMHMLTSLKEKSEKVGLDADEYVLFSKNGFAPELKELKDENLMLLSNEDFSTLLDGLSEKDLLVYKNKKF